MRACDVCQRAGKPNEKLNLPLKLVLLTSEPFKRLVSGIVEPLPIRKSGCRYMLTMPCTATELPEEVSSTKIVKALVDVFVRVGFPREIQCDRGTVFTSAPTMGVVERCSIKLIHSLVLNSVLQALIY